MTTETTVVKHGLFRVGTEPVPHRITDRDVAIGVYLAKHRFLDADQICRLVENLEGGSHANTKRRLTAMFRNGYIGKPAQQDYWLDCGRRDHIYGNLDKMGRRLQAQNLIPTGRLDWTKRVRTNTNETVGHTVENSELMVTLETTLRKYADYSMQDKNQLFHRLPERTQTYTDPWFIQGKPAGIASKKKPRNKPDNVFSIIHHGQPGETEQYKVVEIDTGSMTVVRGAKKFEGDLKRALIDYKEAKTKASQASAKLAVDQARFRLLEHSLSTNQNGFLAKLIKYYWAYRDGWHKDHLGWSNIQHLILTRTVSHRNRMIEALHYVTGGRTPNLFIFTTFDEIRACDDLLEHAWLNGAGEPFSLKQTQQDAD